MSEVFYQVCPKCGHKRLPGDSTHRDRCPACGLVFAKWLQQKLHGEAAVQRPAKPGQSVSKGLDLKAILLEEPLEPTKFRVLGRALLWAAFLLWGLKFGLMDYGRLYGGLPEINTSFLHGVNLVFHEAGHLLFRPLGEFMGVLGGSLAQLLIPAMLIPGFLWHRDPFAASIGLWWLGQSFMDLAPYIHDARAGQMLLLGGFTGNDAPNYHDWHNLLSRLGWLEYDHRLAAVAYTLGLLAMLAAGVWGGLVLWRQWNWMQRFRGN